MKLNGRTSELVAIFAIAVLIAGCSNPSNDENDVAGNLLFASKLESDLSVPGASQAFLIDYETKGPGGVSAESSGALFVPEGETPSGGWPVVAWAHGTVGVADDCAPSAQPRSATESAYLAQWLSQGYAVAATDYVGLGTAGVHPYLDGPTSGFNVVDAVRAARAVEGPKLSDKWVVVGLSQGAHAAMATAVLATKYAPELDFRGTVANSLPTRSQDVLPIGPESDYPGITSLIAMQLAGLRAAIPELNLDQYLTPVGKQALSDVEASCAESVNERINAIPVGTLFTTAMDDPRIKDAYTALADVPALGYDRPVFIAQGNLDRLVTPTSTRKHVELLRENNVDFTYNEYPSDHVEVMEVAFPDASTFVKNVMTAGIG